MSYNSSVKISSRIFALIFVIGFIVAVTLVYDRAIPRELHFVVAVIIAYIMAMRLLVEFSARAIHRLRVERIYEKPLIEGKETRFVTRIINNTVYPLLYVEVSDNYPGTFTRTKGASIVSGMIPAKGFLELTYWLIPRIGTHEFTGVEVITRDPLGLFYYKTIIPGSSEVVKVKPKPMPLPPRIIGRWVTTSLGLSKARIKGIGQEFMGLREYMPGDDYRFIEWKAFARSNKLFVKEFEREASLNLVIVVDATPVMYHGVLGKTMLEESIRVIAGIGQVTCIRGDWLGLTIRMPDKILFIPPRRGKLQYYRMLDAMADIRIYLPGKEPRIKYSLGDALRYSIIKLPKRTKTLFLVFTSISAYASKDQGKQELLDLIDAANKALAMRHGVVVVSPLPELFELEEIKGPEASLYTILAYPSIAKSSEIAKLLARNGVKVIQVGPSTLLPRLLLFIEEFRSVML